MSRQRPRYNPRAYWAVFVQNKIGDVLSGVDGIGSVSMCPHKHKTAETADKCKARIAKARNMVHLGIRQVITLSAPRPQRRRRRHRSKELARRRS